MVMHAEVDLETLDTTPTSVVLSIGLTVFNPYADDVDAGYYWVLDTAEQDQTGRTRSASTMKWWAEQSPEARRVLYAPGTPVIEVLRELMPLLNGDEIGHIWGNGADFDCVILRNLCEQYGFTWPYRKNRCHRTLKQLQLPEDIALPERQGVHHNALDDAVHQARCLQRIVGALNLRFD